MLTKAQIQRARLSPYETTFNANALDNALERVHADWERDLRPLLPQFVSYEEVVQGDALVPLRSL